MGRVEASLDSLLVPGLGLQRQLQAAAFGEGGEELSGVSVRWGVRDPVVATVSGNGTVTSRGYGVTSVVVSAGGVADTVLLDVAQVPRSVSFESDGDTIYSIGAGTRFYVVAEDSAGADMSRVEGVWGSSDESVAQVNQIGRVRAIGPGKSTITWTTRGVTGGREVTVDQQPVTAWVRGGRNPLAIGDTTQLSGSLFDAEQNEIAGASVTWSVSDTLVATVSQSGVLTAVGPGNVVVRIEGDDLVDEHARSVEPSVALSGPLQLTPAEAVADVMGQTFVLESRVDDGTGELVSVPATWVTRNWDVAGRDGALAWARGEGETWLVASYEGFTDSIRVVVDQVATGLSFRDRTRAFTVNLTDGARIYPVLEDRLGNPIESTSGQAVLTSRDTTIVSITGNLVNGVRRGRAWVIVELGSFTDSLDVTVVPTYTRDLEIRTVQDLMLVEASGVEEVRGDVTIVQSALSHVDGLESIRIVHGAVAIQANPNLADISGLSGLDSIGGRLSLDRNPMLADVTMPGLSTAGEIWYFENADGTAAVPFPALTHVEGTLYMTQAGPAMTFPSLQSTGPLRFFFHGPDALSFPALEVVTGGLELVDLAETESFSAPRLWRVRSLLVRADTVLHTLALDGLTTVERDVEIVNNPLLQGLSGLRISSAVRDLRIRGNGAFTTVSGLLSLGEAVGSDPLVARDLWIENHPGVSSAEVDSLLTILEARYPGTAFLGLTATGGNGGG